MIHVTVGPTRELTNVMNCDHCNIVRHFHSMCKVQKSGVGIPYALSQNHKNQRVAICTSLLARHRLARVQHRPFLSCIVTGDEKLCLYVNTRKRKEWLSPKVREEYAGNVPISSLGTPFSSVHGPTHYLQMTISICKLKHNNWISNKKWQSINKPICTVIPTRETKSLRNYAQPNILYISFSARRHQR